MGIVAKYKFNQNIYENFIPVFNSEFTNYTITDEVDTDSYTIRTIKSDSLPTLIRFGATTQTDREKSLLEVYECNTENVTSMYVMFYNCSSLTSLDVSNFDTSKVTAMNGMFNKCTSLISLDLSNFNTSKVTNMGNMFNNCTSLTSLDLSSFNTGGVIYMDSMFNGCSLLTSLDLSNFNTNKVTNMSQMFVGCSSLTSLDLSNFNTSKVTAMNSMFYGCSSLISLDVSNFNTSQVTNMYTMFNSCSSLTSLDVSNFNTEKVTNMQDMFNGCSSLTSLDVSNFNTEKVTNMVNMFNGCSSLTSLDISNFNTSNVGSMYYIFSNTTNLVDIGMIYCNSDTVNKISDLITTDTTIWYSDAKLEDLTKKENITYKEYKMNILESNEEINLRRIGDVKDELNLLTGELTQRIGEVVLDGSEEIIEWHNTNVIDGIKAFSFRNCANNNNTNVQSLSDTYITYQSSGILNIANGEGVSIASNHCYLKILTSKLETIDVDGLKKYLSQNPITVQYELETPIIKTVNSEGKPSINWQGDTYLHLENNTLYPQLDCEIESINYYEIPKLKSNTLYTLRYVGEPTQCIFGGLTYRAENNMILTSGSSDNLLYFDKEVRKVVLIEGDVRDRNFDYFEGIESLGAVEIITHKTNMPIFAKGGRK